MFSFWGKKESHKEKEKVPENEVEKDGETEEIPEELANVEIKKKKKLQM